VGLTPSLVGDNTPNIQALVKEGELRALKGVCPSVTTTAQTTMLTGKAPSAHGIVANGWFFRELSEVWLWRQSNRLVQCENVWDEARRRDPSFTVANLFWWYNMATSADYSLTPRPLYLADGRKLPGVYGRPLDYRQRIESSLSTFPLFNFWGPMAGIKSTEWITDAALLTMENDDPTLTLVYLPHLDYDLQRLGPQHRDIPNALQEVDEQAGRLIDRARATGREILIVSEYGMSPVTDAVHINRVLNEAGFLETTPILDTDELDRWASRALAVADHQIAHVYVRNPADIPAVRACLEATPGIDRVMDRTEYSWLGLDHARSGELLCISDADRWFSYYFWLDDDRAPDYARCVDIHSKPGYDPVELFLNPELQLIKARVAAKLLRKKLGFRTVMDLIPLDTSLVRGSHGRIEASPAEGPLVISSKPIPNQDEGMGLADIRDLILSF
jgi:predicted AlkP superfamily pyrophosphatase or phosphodiesterase